MSSLEDKLLDSINKPEKSVDAAKKPAAKKPVAKKPVVKKTVTMSQRVWPD